MRLVACPVCHAQYDVSHVPTGSPVSCRCGEQIEVVDRQAIDAPVERCASCGALVATGAERCDFCSAEIVHDHAALSLICPECYARNAESARFCAACGVKFAPEPLPGSGPDLPCVDCGKTLIARGVAGVIVSECPACHGLWVPEGTFEELVRRAVQARRSGGDGGDPALRPREDRGNPLNVKVRYRKCPECGSHMLRRNWRKTSGVIVDVCREHGTWLDSDELERIAGFILSGGWEEANRREKERRMSPAPKASPAAAEFTKILMQSNRRRAGSPVLESFVDFLRSVLD